MNQVCHRYLNQNILPFAGREHHLASLKSQFDQFANEGHTTYSLIAGAIGIGKSRIIRELERDLIKEYGDEIVLVHARYLEGNVAALTPVLNALSATVSQHTVIRDVLESLPETKAITSGRLETADTITLQLLLDAAREIGKRFALVLILEDLHNLDDLSALEQLFLGLATVPKHVVFSYRVEGDTQAMRSIDHFVRHLALRDESPLETIVLHEFSGRDIEAIFSILFEIEPSEVLTKEIASVTSGRPLELRTMLRSLISQGILEYHDGVWSESGSGAVLPSASEDEPVMKSRFELELARLSNDEQIAVMHASWLGEQFDTRLLRLLLAYDSERSGFVAERFDRVIQLLTFKSIIRKAVPSLFFAAMRSDRSAEQTEGDHAGYCFEFSHPHFWNTVLDASNSVIAGRHDAVIAIANIASRDNLPLYSSAFLSVSGTPFHLVRSSTDREKVERFLLWSSSVAQALWTREPEQTLRFLLAVRPIRDDIAWQYAPELSEPHMQALLDLHSMLIEALMRSGSHAEAEKDLEHAAVLEKFIGNRAAKGEMSSSFQMLARGKVYCLRAMISISKGGTQEFERATEIAYSSLLPLEEELVERARLLTMLARAKADTLLVAGHLQEADRLLENNLEIAKQLADTRPDEHSQFYRLAVNSKLKQGKNREARELIEQIITQARSRRDAITETTFLYQAAVASFSTGDVIDALRYADQGITYGRRYGIRFAEVMSNIWRMIIAGAQRDPERASECIATLDSILSNSANLLWRISYMESRATTMNFLGRHDEALAHAEEAIRLADDTEYRSFAAWAHNEKGIALNGLGRFDNARDTATNCLLLLGQQVLAERTARTVLVGALTGTREWEQAERELEKVRELAFEKSPFYYRIVESEAKLVRGMLGSPEMRSNRFKLISRLKHIVEEMLSLARQWSATMLEQEITSEYREYVAGHSREEQIVKAAQIREDVVLPKYKMHTLGNFFIEDLELSGDEAIRKARDSKVKRLVGMLLIARMEGRTLSKEALADKLWPDSPVDAQTAALHTSIKRARALLGSNSSITFADGKYELASLVISDVEELTREHDEVRQVARRGASFSVAIRYEKLIRGLGRGRFLDGIEEEWVDGVRTRVETLKRMALERLLHLNIDRSAFDRAEALCHELLTEDEFDILAVRSLISIAAKKHQSSRATQIYESFAAKYRKEFRSEPDPSLKRLTESFIES